MRISIFMLFTVRDVGYLSVVQTVAATNHLLSYIIIGNDVIIDLTKLHVHLIQALSKSIQACDVIDAVSIIFYGIEFHKPVTIQVQAR